MIAYTLLGGPRYPDQTKDEASSDGIVPALTIFIQTSGVGKAFSRAGIVVGIRAKDFLTSVLQTNEDHRPTARQALQHPWLSGGRLTSALLALEHEAVATWMPDKYQGSVMQRIPTLNRHNTCLPSHATGSDVTESSCSIEQEGPFALDHARSLAFQPTVCEDVSTGDTDMISTQTSDARPVSRFGMPNSSTHYQSSTWTQAHSHSEPMVEIPSTPLSLLRSARVQSSKETAAAIDDSVTTIPDSILSSNAGIQDNAQVPQFHSDGKVVATGSIEGTQDELQDSHRTHTHVTSTPATSSSQYILQRQPSTETSLCRRKRSQPDSLIIESKSKYIKLEKISQRHST